ncbi:hypothetical protein RUM43_003465 [Polyplax serrata]|uniref:Uncharacterized protein n=1 Tax=Polyplax serrata TaxID=468196 RepID=A0AAN8RX10_POLSC
MNRTFGRNREIHKADSCLRFKLTINNESETCARGKRKNEKFCKSQRGDGGQICTNKAVQALFLKYSNRPKRIAKKVVSLD